MRRERPDRAMALDPLDAFAHGHWGGQTVSGRFHHRAAADGRAVEPGDEELNVGSDSATRGNSCVGVGIILDTQKLT